MRSMSGPRMAINVSSQTSKMASGIGSSRIIEADPIRRSCVGVGKVIFLAGANPDRLVRGSNFGSCPI